MDDRRHISLDFEHFERFATAAEVERAIQFHRDVIAEAKQTIARLKKIKAGKIATK